VPRYDRRDKGPKERSLIVRIDQALKDLPEVRPGIELYRRRLAEYGCTFSEPPRQLLRQVVVDVAADIYREQADHQLSCWSSPTAPSTSYSTLPTS